MKTFKKWLFMIPFLGFGLWVLGVQQYFGSSEKVSEHYFQDHKYNTQLLLNVWGQDLDYKIWQWVDYLKENTNPESEIPFMALVYGNSDDYKSLYVEDISNVEDLTKNIDPEQDWFSGISIDGRPWVAKKISVEESDQFYLAFMSADSDLVPQISNQVSLYTREGRYLLSHQKDYIGRSVPTPWTSVIYSDNKKSWLDDVALSPLYPSSPLYIASDMSVAALAQANDFYLYLLGFLVFAFLTYLLAKQEQISDQKKLVDEFFEPEAQAQDVAQVKILESEFNDLNDDVLNSKLEPVKEESVTEFEAQPIEVIKPQVEKAQTQKKQEPKSATKKAEPTIEAVETKGPDEWKNLIEELSAELDDIEIQNQKDSQPAAQKEIKLKKDPSVKKNLDEQDLGVAFQSFAKSKKRKPKKSKKTRNLKVRPPRVEI